MKHIFATLAILTLATAMNAQKVGFNTDSPGYSFHFRQPAGSTIVAQQPVLFTEYTGTNLADVIGIRGRSKPADYYGIGGDFEGGYVGVQGRVVNGMNNTYIGVRGDVSGSGAGGFMGIYGYAHGSGTNYAVYGTAAGGLKNWAGYFASGNVYIQNRLGLGNTNPLHPVHINQPSGTTLGEEDPVMHVEYTGSNAENVIAIRGRSILPSANGIGGQFEGGYAGVVARVETNTGGSHFGVKSEVNCPGGVNVAIFGDAKGFEALNYAGYFGSGNVYILNRLGIGRDPETNRLEVNGNASKNSAGDWIANSDARLKKNIQPLDEQETIEKLLSLKGITYEWNDDQTGMTRPDGIQYGFTAQNIRDVFPSLVSEDNDGFLQTAYGTYDAMMVEAIRYLYQQNQMLAAELAELKASLHRETQAAR